MKYWLSIIETGAHSDTFIFFVGVFTTEEGAKREAEYLVAKSSELNRLAEAAGSREDWDLEEQIEKEHAKVFNERWFPPKPRNEWRVSVTEIEQTPIRVF